MQTTFSFRQRNSQGGTLLGFLFGLISGLAVAVVVALYITKAPVPFSSKTKEVAQPGTNQAATKGGQTGNDPNQSLYPKNPPANAVAPNKPATDLPFDAPLPIENKPAADTTGKEPAKEPAKDDGLVYFLQAGAFKTLEDAEQMKGRLALLGAEAKISTVDVEGRPLYRVRLGPFRQLDETKSPRKSLSENGIEASVVKQKIKTE